VKTIVSSNARADLRAIYKYIDDNLQNDFAAHNTIEKIIRKISQIGEFPLLSPIDKEISDEKFQYRHRLSGNYLIFYRLTDDQIIIVRILYGKMDYRQLFDV
jgi:plasmid stabilization system protein ParE